MTVLEITGICLVIAFCVAAASLPRLKHRCCVCRREITDAFDHLDGCLES